MSFDERTRVDDDEERLGPGAAREAIAVADRTGLVLMEAFHYRYHSQMTRASSSPATAGSGACSDSRRGCRSRS